MLTRQRSAARISLVVIIGLIGFKVAVAVITGSISILAQAADSFLDLFAVAINLVAISIATKPADELHPFGHGKAEHIAAVVQAALIFTAGGLIIYFAMRRLVLGTTVEMAEAGVGVMLVSIIASVFLSRHLRRVSQATDSLALDAMAHNITADIYSAAGVLVGLAVVRFTGLGLLDPVIALVVAVFILKAGYDVMRKSFGGLMDVRLPEAEETIIRASILEREGKLVGFHTLRTRKAGNQRYIDLHLVVPKMASVEEAHCLCDELEREIVHRLGNTNVIIHIEPCDGKCDRCPIPPERRQHSF